MAREITRQVLHGLTTRLALGVLALGTLLGALLLSGVLYFVVEDYKAQFVNNVRSQSRMLAGLVGAELDDRAEIQSLFSELLLGGEVVYVEVAMDDPDDPRAIAPNDPQGKRDFKEDFFFGEHGDNVYYISAPVADRDARPRGTLNLGFDESYTREQIARIYRRGFYFAGGYTILLLILAILLGMHLGRPLRQLREASREIASGHFDRPLTVDSRLAEVAYLSEDLETMRRELIHRGREIAAREERHRAVLEHAAEGIVTLDGQGRIESFNAAAERIFGYSATEVAGTPFTRFFSLAEAGRVIGPDGLPHIASGVTLTARRKDGGTVPVQLSIGAFQHGEEKLYTVVAQDISERMQFEEKLARLAYYDPLTGLPNRRLFHDRLAQALARAQRNEKLVGILFFDLDRFKEVNDTLGHLFGDLLLQAAAKRLTEVVRKDDSIARLGGDEFTIVLTDISNVEDAAQVAEKVIGLFSKPFQIGEHEVFVSTSIGITIYPFDDSDIENLIKNADTAMYKAKSLGRNNYQFYDARLGAQSQERLVLETSLRKAVQQGNLTLYFQPQVLLHYQPQYDRFSGQIVGAEALARWQHPDLGLLYPERFIALAEETGLIIPVGEWLLRAACEQSVAWRKQGLPPLRVAVNISPRQLQYKGIVEQVGRVIEETGVDPAHLEIELTESLILHNHAEIKSVLFELKNMGLTLAIDDFGTGHSSLANLQLLPIDAVKIDKSFVHNITHDEHSAAIAMAVIEMAHKLGIRVVAEGVEMEEQLVYLHSHQCDIMQGYYFSRPVPAADFETLLNADMEMQNPLKSSRDSP
ncbi:MAG: EAL domain-containing protein [Sulfuricaulis sp.]|uniref:putative bifunctional diguanylate cyclase/phosphodiesterase n=1 Tax=Sulfuricaulis sp. TaxID=2003553 RepID=UPI0025E1AD2F|nr:EAL domain-containing protein [Sulfuricaulis sp.]MCR4346662.1 EAL domain-containing protein [Sulfuricaulis sp.]